MVSYLSGPVRSRHFPLKSRNSTAKSEQKNWSESHSHSEQSGSSSQHGESRESIAGKTVKGVASAASILGAALAPFTGGASLAIGGVVSGGLGMLGCKTETEPDLIQSQIRFFFLYRKKSWNYAREWG